MATFKTVHTVYGLRRLAAAEVSGVPINLPTVAVGDGNGNPVEPSDAQSQLVRERFRAAVNRVYQEANKPTHFIVELVIPLAVGGFTLREFGVFDDTGALFVCGNLPAMYKPTAEDGAFTDTIVRVEFAAQNATVITLQIDPNIAVASQSWVVNNVTSALLIPGGTTGQLLRKTSNADGDTEWHDPDAINVTVDTIEETQELAAGQTVVDLAVTTTRGLALYVEGERLRRDEWTPDLAVFTRLTLGTDYPAGTKLIAAQNEPTGNAPAPLERSKNLSDVQSAPISRSNLGVFSKEETRQMAPPGMMAMFFGANPPAGWFEANFAEVSRTAYSELFAEIGTFYGPGDGFNTFNLPEGRGEMFRGWDHGRGLDVGRARGSIQASQNLYHAHTAGSNGAGGHAHAASSSAAGGHTHGAGIGGAGAHAHSAGTDVQGNHVHAVSMQTRQNDHGPSGKFGDNGNPAFGDTVTSGSMQAAGAHGHNVTVNPTGDHVHSVAVYGVDNHAHGIAVQAVGDHAHGIYVNPEGGTEARPRNMALLVCIKY